MRISFLFILGCSFLSCQQESRQEVAISKIDVNFNIERFDSALLNAEYSDFSKLKRAYPFLFSKQVSDTEWKARITDTLQRQLLLEVNSVFEDLSETKLELVSLFQHLKYFNTTFSIPRVVTLTNNVDYRTKNIVNDTLVLIALDNYLGDEHRFYKNIPKYLTSNMGKSQIVVDLAAGYAEKYVFQAQKNSFLDEMIYAGKLLYFKDVMLSNTLDEDKIGYSKTQLQWAETNQSAIWRYFIDNELLFSTDSKLINRFIAEAPFSKFYLELDRKSPGRLGQYIGWQIVKAYANNSEENIMQILQIEPQEIFRKSKFKPRK